MRILYIISLVLLHSFFLAQTNDSVSLNSSCSHQSFYNFNDGEIANVDNTNWDLAFSSGGYGSAIRINSQAGVELYVYPNGDINDWNSVDITNISNWPSIINSDTTWSIGAFNATSDPTNSLDLGWGVYSTITHHITGDSLHIIKLSNGDYKKLQMIKLSSGNYEFKYANIDGTNEVVTSVSKSNYTSKNFGYYSITNNNELDREPTSSSWHILFTKYVTEIYPGMNYGVTGVLTNKNIEVAKAENVDLTNVSHSGYSFSSQINTIGYDWKSYNMNSFSYDITDSLCFFVKDDQGSIWKLQLTGFEGNSTGNIHFNVENILSASDNITDKNIFAIYPNPTTSKEIKIIYDINHRTSSLNKVKFFDINGKLVKSLKLGNNGFNERNVNLYDLKSGVYFVSLITDEKSFQQKLIIQ